jgi:hypothetical protein
MNIRISDDRIVYGARCTWWDGIEQVGSKGQGPLGGLPCCPHYRNMLFEMPTPKVWWDGVAKFEAAGHDGYRSFVEWMKGKCFPNIQAAQAAYQAKPGRTVRL